MKQSFYNESMKTWTELEVLLIDYKNALIEQNSPFSKKILSLLNTNPRTLLREFKDHPNARIVTKNGDWMSIWAVGVKIDGQYYEHKTVLHRVEELLDGVGEH